MRKEYRKAVRERFAVAMREQLPGFDREKVKADVLFGGETVFRWAVCNALHCFTILSPDPKGRQAFTVELAWSGGGGFPEVTSRPTLMLGPGEPAPIDEEEAIVRLGDLATGEDSWWSLPDPALERPADLSALQKSLEPIDPEVAAEHTRAPVESAMELLLEHGVPFFERLAELRCDGGSPRERA